MMALIRNHIRPRLNIKLLETILNKGGQCSLTDTSCFLREGERYPDVGVGCWLTLPYLPKLSPTNLNSDLHQSSPIISPDRAKAQAVQPSPHIWF